VSQGAPFFGNDDRNVKLLLRFTLRSSPGGIFCCNDLDLPSNFIYTGIYVHMNVCVCMYMYGLIHIHMGVCVYMCICTCIFILILSVSTPVCHVCTLYMCLPLSASLSSLPDKHEPA